MVAASAIIPFYPRKSAGKTHDEPMDTVRGLPEGEPSLAWGASSGWRELRVFGRDLPESREELGLACWLRLHGSEPSEHAGRLGASEPFRRDRDEAMGRLMGRLARSGR